MRDLRDINEMNAVLARNAGILRRYRPVDVTGDAPRKAPEGAATPRSGGAGYAPSLAVFKARDGAVNEPIGHAGTGGIQRHSLGDEYPWTVVGYGDGTWAGENLTTGTKLHKRRTYKEAEEDVRSYQRLVVIPGGNY